MTNRETRRSKVADRGPASKGLPPPREFPIELQTHFRGIGRWARQVKGIGTTLALSSEEVSFVTRDDLQIGARLELAVSWPALLDGKTPLQLVIRGTVIRRVNSRVTLNIRRREFRTQRSADVEPARLDGASGMEHAFGAAAGGRVLDAHPSQVGRSRSGSPGDNEPSQAE